MASLIFVFIMMTIYLKKSTLLDVVYSFVGNRIDELILIEFLIYYNFIPFFIYIFFFIFF
jgi:hypothetical protein